MNLDSFTISALVDEFMDVLVGGRVQATIDVDPTGYGLEIYAHGQRRYLYMSGDKQTPRFHLVGDKLRRGVFKKTQLSMLIRRYLDGAVVTHVSQPQWERIIFIDFEHSVEGESRIVIEPMPRRANILLVRDGVVRDCVHRIGPDDNSYRLSLPNHDYELPPPLTDRINPFDCTVGELDDLFASVDKPEKQKLFRLMPSKFFGFSPLLAKEIAYRVTGNDDATIDQIDTGDLHDAIATLMHPLQKRIWRAGVAGEDFAEAYSVYPLTHIPNWREMDSVSAAMTEYYGAAVGEDAYNQAKSTVQEGVDEAKAKYSAKLKSLENSLRDDSEIAFLQQSGELILAYQYTLEPTQTELVAQYDPEGEPLTITLDTDLSPLENAQRYFDKYNRAKRAKANVPKLIAEARNDYNYALQLENDLKLASNWDEIDDVIQALQNRGFAVTKKQLRRMGGGGRKGPMKLQKDGYLIYVGRNSRQNEEVTMRIANSNDFWLHARDVPGAHVVIRDDGRRIPDSLIEEAAAIAAYYSSKQTDTKVDVDITRIKYVKPIRGAGAGMVTYRNERTLTVQPHNEEILANE